ncbi:peptidoglycan editing factor PgeF [Patescibacteria group bacterium]
MKKAFFDSEDVLAVFTDREGGVSKKPYDSLNLAFHVGDEFQDVLRNRKVILDNLGIREFAWMNQVHSDTVKIIENEGESIATDAIITKKKRIALMVMVADCNPILIYDPVKRVVAAVHAGREGVFNRIAQKTIEEMKREFGSNPEDVFVSVGPSIGPCCYEVGKKIIEEFRREFGEKYIRKTFFLDLKTLNFDQLVESGVKKENIEVADECTACTSDHFSYRRHHRTGRFAGIIMIRQ